MKALNVLKSPIVEIGSDSDPNLHSNAVVLFATREQIQEAIAELEALQQPKSCYDCKHWFPNKASYPCNQCSMAINCLFEPNELKMMEEDAQQYALKCRKELEALQQRSCDGCIHRSELHEGLTNGVTNGFCVENGFFTRRGFCCNRYEPKESI